MKKIGKSLLAMTLSFSMMFNGGLLVMAEELAPVAIQEDYSIEETEVIDTVEEIAGGIIDAPDVKAGSEISIEINQGLSKYAKPDSGADDEYYMNDFSADKATVIMFEIPESAGKDEAAAKEAVKNYSLTAYATNTDGSDGEAKLTIAGDKFVVKHPFDNNGVEETKWMAVANADGENYIKFTAGKYNFVLKDGDNQVGRNDKVDFYATNPLKILAVPVTSYYSTSDKTSTGACPEKYFGQAVPCTDELWNGIDTKLVNYLKNVYPLGDIKVTLGNTVEAGTAEYDMVTSDGQKKLWEECNKLMTKDKETGKDEYDIILAFVMYRQDMGTGQGYTFGRPTNIITLTDGDMLPTVAHEIAHCYQVGDEYDGGSFNLDVNKAPNGYKGRNFVSGADMTVDGVSAYWIEPSKSGISGVNENGKGTIVKSSLHPYKTYGDDEGFVKYNKEGETVSPVISYMGSGYTGDDGFYWTSSSVWQHLLKEFMVKEKQETSNNDESQEQPQEESAEELTNADVFLLANDVRDPSVSSNSIFELSDFYYEDGYREGESRMLEVSGWLVKKDGKVAVEMNPCFSYEGDLEYMDWEELPKGADPYTFAAVDNKGKIINAVDGDLAASKFNGVFYNTFEPKKAVTEVAFSFDAVYPNGTYDLVIFKGEPEAGKKYGESDIIWSARNNGVEMLTRDDKGVEKEESKKVNLDEEIECVLEYADVNETFAEIEWSSYIGDADEPYDGHSGDLYTEVYYCPEGDEGDVFYVACSDDDDWEEGAIKIDTTNSKDGYGYTKSAYVWVKVTNGINAWDIYSDENDISVANSQIVLTGAGIKSKKTKEGKVYAASYTGAEIAPKVNVKALDPETGKYSIKLEEGIDFKVTYKNNIKAGTATVIVEGIGAYDGRNSQEFTINRAKISGTPNNIPDLENDKDFANNVINNLAVVDKNGNVLTYNKDFVINASVDGKKYYAIKDAKDLVTLANNGIKSAASASRPKNYCKMTIKYLGKGNYEKTLGKKESFLVYKEGSEVVRISACEIKLKQDKYQYTGKAIKAKIDTVTISGNKVKSSNYKVVYSNNKELGTATLTLVGKNGYVGKVSKTFKIIPKEIKAFSVSGVKNVTYKISANKISVNDVPVVVKAGNLVLKEGIDYKVSLKNTTNKVTGKNDPKPEITVRISPTAESRIKWVGTEDKKSKSKTFKIVPEKLSKAAAVKVELVDKRKVSANNIVINDVSEGISKNCIMTNAKIQKGKKQPYSFVITGEAEYLSDKADVTKAIEMKVISKVYHLDTKDFTNNFDVKVKKTKAGKTGTITITPKADNKNFSGKKVVKFKYENPVKPEESK